MPPNFNKPEKHSRPRLLLYRSCFVSATPQSALTCTFLYVTVSVWSKPNSMSFGTSYIRTTIFQACKGISVSASARGLHSRFLQPGPSDARQDHMKLFAGADAVRSNRRNSSHCTASPASSQAVCPSPLSAHKIQFTKCHSICRPASVGRSHRPFQRPNGCIFHQR